jgi:hypothetical protein
MRNYILLSRIVMIVLATHLFPRFVFADTNYDTQIEELKKKTEAQDLLIQEQQKTIQNLTDRMTELEQKLNRQAPSQPPSPPAAPASSGTVHPGVRVDLTAEEYPSLPLQESGAASPGSVLESPWWKNIRLSGYGAAGFVETGKNANQKHGSFLNYEGQLLVDAKVWEDIYYFQKIQLARVGEDPESIHVEELYINLKDVFKTLFKNEGKNVGIKLGRMDVPFGEDYLTQHVMDNPLITLSAPFPYGQDEGVLVYSHNPNFNWIASVMKGNDDRVTDDTNSKSVSLKLYGNPAPYLYLSGSFMRNGQSGNSALEFDGSHLDPVGQGGLDSSLGASQSKAVNAYSYEADAKYILGFDRYVKLQYGYTQVDDKEAAFSRGIHYFQIEPKWNFGPRFKNRWYVVGRFSAIGTFNDGKGYSFDGEPFADGNTAFGFDTKILYRYAVGLGFMPNPSLLFKLEYSIDDFRLIRSSDKEGGSDGRDFVGLETAVKF